MSWWKGLIASILPALSEWGTDKLSEKSKVVPMPPKRPVKKAGKKVE